jgi:hypothetical protein
MLRLAAFAALPLVISGCDLIAAYLSPMPIGGFGDPETTTAYSTGTATVQITQGGTTQTISLDISPGSTYDSYVGAIVSWENDEGWTVMVDAYDESLLGGVSVPGLMDGDVTISRIEGHEFWTAGSYTGLSTAGCGVKVSEMTPVKVAGRVTCSQLRWTDGTSWSLDGPQYIEGQDPFDVTIDFEAEASPEPSGQTS